VVHKGYLPTNEEAMDYGKFVYGYVVSIVGKLRQSFDNEMGHVFLKRDAPEMSARAIREGRNYATSSIGSLFGVNVTLSDFGKGSFEECLDLRRMNRAFGP
jgi:hypothetical protein